MYMVFVHVMLYAIWYNVALHHFLESLRQGYRSAIIFRTARK